jgi:hypothetical protein
LPREVKAVFDDFSRDYRPLLKEELLAVYATGSATQGDYVSGSSDIDGIAVLREGWRTRCDMSEVEAAWKRLEEAHRGTALQIQFLTTAQVRDTIPLVDIEAWHTSGCLLFGCDVRNDLPRPTLETLRLDMTLVFLGRYGSPFGSTLPYNWDPVACLDTFLRHPSMITLWIVFPARVLCTWDCGRAASKTGAVRWYFDRYPGPASRWMQEALAWRAQGFPTKEQVVASWGPRIPGLTHCLSECLEAHLLGAPHGLDQAPSGTLDEVMRRLAEMAAKWLDSVPALERRRGNLSWIHSE